MGSLKHEAETMELYPKATEGGTFILITNGLCIAPWKNIEIEDYLIPMFGWVFLVFPSLSEIVHKGKDSIEEVWTDWKQVCISLAKADGEDTLT